MKLSRIIILITIPVVLVVLFTTILTTKPYLTLSKGMYDSHQYVYFDHDYAVERIIGYLNYRYDNLEFGVNESDSDLIMRDTEIRHMVDVKNLYTGLRILALVSLISGGIHVYKMYKKDPSELYRTLKQLYKGPIIFIGVVGTAMVIDFDTAFRIFHQIFFTNNDWLLYPDDVLILLLPQTFWMVSGFIIIVLFAASLGIIHYLNERFLSKYSS